MPRRHRVALLDEAAEHVLLVDRALPTTSDAWPSAAELRAAVGSPGAIPGPPPWCAADGTVTNVLVGASDRGVWGPVDTVPGLADAAARWRAGTPADDGADWFSRGWWESVLAWLDDVTPERSGPPETVRAWGFSAVLRVPVGGRDLWLKAAADAVATEPALTAAVSALAPDATPRIVALDHGRRWMLMEPIPGAAEGITTVDEAVVVARRLAELQLDSRSHGDALRAAGAPDRGLDGTLAMVGEVLHHSVDALTDTQRALAPTLEPWLVERLREFWSGPLPDTLVHGDLHCANVGRPPVIFDWTDLCLSHPFLDARHLALSAEQHDPTAADAVWAAYLEPWRAAYPHADLDTVRAALPVAEAAFQAVTYERLYRGQAPGSRWELATVVGRRIDQLAALRATESPG